jgi:IS66 C-terminal element
MGTPALRTPRCSTATAKPAPGTTKPVFDDSFLGSDEVGENLAGLYSLIATCEANEVDPVDYLADVLIRVQTHPASKIDDLLPHNWTPLQPESSA